MARYIPVVSKESFTSSAQMSKAMRGLFSGDIYSVGGGCLATEDKNVIRVWAKEFFDKQRGLGLGLPQHLREHFMAMPKLRERPGFTIEKSRITDLIPKTIQHRKGHHKFVLLSFGKKDVVINNSKGGEGDGRGLQSEVHVLSDVLATNLLPIKDPTITVRLIRNKGKKNLLITSNQFEIFFK
jgi:hypothetical protein